MKPRQSRLPERTSPEICCLDYFIQHFWPKVVLKKWLNINTTTESDFSADTEDEGESGSDSDKEESGELERESRLGNKKGDADRSGSKGILHSETLPRVRRRNSETLRSQYINTKELRIRVGTWNVGGKLPPDDLDIKDWLDLDEPADIYVVGLQEIVPLNAGNIFGAEDSRPVPRWECIIRDALNSVRPSKTKIKCYSDPPSPLRFKPLDDIPDIVHEIFDDTDTDGDEFHLMEDTDSGGDEEVHPVDEEFNHINEITEGPFTSKKKLMRTGAFSFAEDSDIDLLKKQVSLPQVHAMNSWFGGGTEKVDVSVAQRKGQLTRTLSMSERISLSWPEPPLNLLPQRVLERPNSLRSGRSLRVPKSFRTYNSFKPSRDGDNKESPEIALLAEIDLEAIILRKRRSPFVRIVSKQMVGIFLTIWVRRSLRRHIQNLKVSTVGVGVMGYIGNKGSVSVSMSIYQTPFCFICTHLTSGEKEGDELRRNADVREIHRRTHFYPASCIGFPKTIYDHERIIWLGDLNYRINLSYEKTRELISKKDWSRLSEKDQLIKELRKGRAFDGWTEGSLNFPPTYKYEFNSEKYVGEDPKAGRRTPAWCDRILSFGKGMRLLDYEMVDQKLSDHRPVKAVIMAEVEVFSHRKLQKALTFTDAELEDGKVMPVLEIDAGMSLSMFGQGISELGFEMA